MPFPSFWKKSRPEPGEATGKPGGLGTFGGVYTPSILTILGVIMYLRFGWVVGNVGLLGTFAIVTLSTAITFLTGLSIASIATDQRVRIGGAYFMISRSLGIEAGGAVGVPLFFAQALSVGLYVLGFAESVVRVFPSLDEKAVAIVTTIGVTLIALRSASAAIRAQYVIMAAIGLSLVSLLFGRSLQDTPVEWWVTSEAGRASFWVVFAVFFPAVTGIMAGVNMSGDLRDPARSIPRGTLAAIGTGYLVYMAIPVLLSLRASPEALMTDSLIMRRMALWGDAILLGVWGATLSSAVGSILGAPRVLQALARDGVLPGVLRRAGAGSGEMDEPRVGTGITFAVALSAVLLGDLDLIAPILTMFFLTTYGVLNVSAGLERFLGNPSYRPRFRVHWFWSLAGAIGCVAVMFLINAVATVVAVVVVVIIFVWLERRELSTAWGDVRDGLWMAIARAGLLRVKDEVDAKNWRPHLLALSGAPVRRRHLVDFATAVTHNRALLTISSVVPESVPPDRLRQMETSILGWLRRRSIDSLVRLVASPDPFEGAVRLVETYGLGSLVPNTVLLGASENASVRESYCSMISGIFRARRNVLVMRYDEHRGFGRRRRIDVWWGGLKRNGGLMMVLAYLLRTSQEWRNAAVTVKVVAQGETAGQQIKANLVRLLQESRTGAEAEVLLADGRPFGQILRESSSDADLVLMGMAEPDNGDFVGYYERLQEWSRGLPTTVFVLAAEEIAFGEIILS